MAEPFSRLVSSAAWRADVEEWVHERVEEKGHRVTGPFDQRRIAPWSTQIVVPSDVGPLWFKALCPSMSFEPALQDLLARLAPRDVDRPYAIDARRGWMITSDRGATLGDRHEPTLDDWCAVVGVTAHLQRTVAPHRDEVLATGVADCSPATVPRRLEELVERFSALSPQHPGHVDASLRSELLGTVPRLADACAEIEASPMPVTVQHGDLHPWNVFAADGDLRVFDFGDVQWAPAVEVLSVPYGIITDEGRLPWEPVMEAYAEPWSDLVDARSLETLWRSAALTRPVNRAQTWADCLDGATEQELSDWGIAALHHLRKVLDA